MENLQESIEIYRRQLEEGAVQKAYLGLMEYIMGLRTHFMKQHPEYSISGSIYQGYMDMSYFSVVPGTLKPLKLKVAIVFVYETFRFEVWLAAANKRVQAQYWELIKESGWDKYHIVPATAGYDSIIEAVLVEEPDFSDPDALTEQIESGTLAFIADVERFLAIWVG